MKTLKDTVDRVLKRLEDSKSRVWSRSEIEGYVQSGYDNLVRDARCLWDMTFIAEDVTYCANHVASWEEDYMDAASGFIILGIFNFTGGTGTPNPPLWENQYLDNGVGPTNHTNLWEDDYTVNDFFLSTAQLPKLILDVERVTFDNYRIDPQLSRDLGAHYKFYEYIQGPQRGYALDKDGYFTIRKVPVPSGRGDTYTHQQGTSIAKTGILGLLREASSSEFETSPDIRGTYGILRSFPKHFAIGSYGFPRRLYSDVKNFRVEYFRRGQSLNNFQFEIPDRYVKYVELYAMSLARERDGVGQNKQIAAHFKERYQQGLTRLKNRAQLVNKERVHKMGGEGMRGSWPTLAKLPYHYPYVPDNH